MQIVIDSMCHHGAICIRGHNDDLSKEEHKMHDQNILLEFAIQSGLPTALDYHERRYKKFAELIIRQCAQIAEQRTNTDDIAKLIKKHFGIE